MNHGLGAEVKSPKSANELGVRRSILGLYFEAGLFFVYAYVNDLANVEECEAVVRSGPVIRFEDDWLAIHLPGRRSRFLFRDGDDHDECGLWPKNEDRNFGALYDNATLSIPNFVRLFPSDGVLQLKRHWILEYQTNREGRYLGVDYKSLRRAGRRQSLKPEE